MIRQELQLAAPEDFNFRGTILSHGWHRLAPFAYDEAANVLHRPEWIEGQAVMLEITSEDDAIINITAESSQSLDTEGKEALLGRVRTMLSLEQDIAEFHEAIRGDTRYEWVIRHKLGRFLVSPTVWEDLAKTLSTTNTTWNASILMCQKLAALGVPIESSFTFPQPQQIALKDVAMLAQLTRFGYRAPNLWALANAIVDGELSPEAWRSPNLPPEDLYGRVKALRGFGPYAAGNMLKLLGRFGYLAIDTNVRDVFRVQLNNGRPVSDNDIESHYGDFGMWAGLAMWFDVMRARLQPYLDGAGPTSGMQDAR